MDDYGRIGRALLTNSVDVIRGCCMSGYHVVCLVFISRYRMTLILSSCGCFRLTCPLLREESACHSGRVISQDEFEARRPLERQQRTFKEERTWRRLAYGQSCEPSCRQIGKVLQQTAHGTTYLQY